MGSRKNHHFVPQFYFRRFSLDQRSICVLRRDTGEVVRQASIKSQACKSRFYGEDSMEEALGSIEGLCSSALRQLVEVKNPMLLSQEDRNYVLTWLALQRSRTMAAREIGQPMRDALLPAYIQMTVGEMDNYSDSDKLKLQDAIDSEFSPVRNQLTEMGIATECAPSLGDLCPLLLFNSTNRPFIFGDAPVVFYNGFCRDVVRRGVLGFDTPGLLVIFPLTPHALLLLVDAEIYKIKRARLNQIKIQELRDVAALNKLQLHSASSCVYFNEFRFQAYVSELWRSEKHNLRAPLGHVNEGPGFCSGTGESVGEIIHAFQPQLPYKLSLSFLEHEVMSDREYRFSRRSERSES